MAKQQITFSFKNNNKDTKTYKAILKLDDRVEAKAVLYEYFVLGHRFKSEVPISKKLDDKNESSSIEIIHTESLVNSSNFESEGLPDILNF